MVVADGHAAHLQTLQFLSRSKMISSLSLNLHGFCQTSTQFRLRVQRVIDLAKERKRIDLVSPHAFSMSGAGGGLRWVRTPALK